MKNKGFTLVELLAVIVILSLVITIGTFSVMKIRNNSLKKIVDTKVNDLEASAIVYGQEEPDILDSKCNIDGVEYSFCKKVSVVTLIKKGYYETRELNSNNQKDLINNVTRNSMLCDELYIYRKNNRVYAKMIDIKSNNESNVCNETL